MKIFAVILKSSPIRLGIAVAVLSLAITENAASQDFITYDPPKAIDKSPRTCPKKMRHEKNNDTGNPKIIYWCSPLYPERCIKEAEPSETVHLLYDVGSDGKPLNVRITRTTNECFIEAAAISVLQWRYEQSEEGAQNLTVTITMNFER
jgi:hypothetical protein